MLDDGDNFLTVFKHALGKGNRKQSVYSKGQEGSAYAAAE